MAFWARPALEVGVGLRSRLTIIITLGLGLSFVASLVLLVRLEERTEYRDAAERAGALLHTVSVPVALLYTQGRVADLDNLMSELDDRKETLDLSELVLVDTEGQILTHSDPDRYGTRIEGDPFLEEAVRSPVPLVERSGGFPTRVAVPVQTGIRWATLAGTLSAPAVQRRVEQTQLRLVVIALTVSSLGLITLLFILSIWVIAPIRAVSAAARRLAEGDFSARAPVTGEDEISFLARVLNDGAERTERYTAELEAAVAERTRDLTEANQRLEQLAITDGLTGLYNHRHFHQLLSQEMERQKRTRRPFCVIMADVDHFKHYNDTHGHPAGDEVLKQLAALFKQNIRSVDVVARYGGEEFILLLLEASVDNALERADSLRTLVAEHPFRHAEEQPLGCVSVSMGVAVWPDDGQTPEQIVEAADRALYRSKAQGRNTVTAAAGAAAQAGGEPGPDEEPS